MEESLSKRLCRSSSEGTMGRGEDGDRCPPRFSFLDALRPLGVNNAGSGLAGLLAPRLPVLLLAWCGLECDLWRCLTPLVVEWDRRRLSFDVLPGVPVRPWPETFEAYSESKLSTLVLYIRTSSGDIGTGEDGERLPAGMVRRVSLSLLSSTLPCLLFFDSD